MAALLPRDDHSSWTPVAGRLTLPTRTTGPETNLEPRAPRHPYSVLLPVGFTMPVPLPGPRWALTPPFHPYRAGRIQRGGLLSAALSLGSPPPDVNRHRVSVEPGLSSPAALRPLPERPSGQLTSLRWQHGRPRSRQGASGLAESPRYFSNVARSRSSVISVDRSRTPSTNSGRKWRWKAVTTAAISSSNSSASPSP